MDQAARALVRVDPVADLEQGELEEPLVHDVALVRSDLDAIADDERPSRQQEQPAGEVLDRVLEREREPRREQAEERGDRSEPGEPDAADQQDRQEADRVGDRLVPLVARARLGRAAPDEVQDDPAREQQQQQDDRGLDEPQLQRAQLGHDVHHLPHGRG